jgi:hypothetical protein
MQVTTLPRISVLALLGALPAYCVQSETSAAVSPAGNPLPAARSPTAPEFIIGPAPFGVILPGSAIARGSAMRAGSAAVAASPNARAVSTVVRWFRLRPWLASLQWMDLNVSCIHEFSF